MTVPIQQGELPLQPENRIRLLGVEMVRPRPSFLSAINLCVEQATGTNKAGHARKLENKQIYTELGVDAGHWTRITDGKAHLAANLFNPLMNICGNYAPLEWLAWSNGFDLVKRKTRLERELEAERKRADEAEKKNEYLLEIVNGGRR